MSDENIESPRISTEKENASDILQEPLESTQGGLTGPKQTFLQDIKPWSKLNTESNIGLALLLRAALADDRVSCDNLLVSHIFRHARLVHLYLRNLRLRLPTSAI